MTMLPKGWRETEKRSNREGSWRFQVRSVKRFRPATLRTVALEGVEGVKLVAGKLLEDELGTHGADSMVPQAVMFSKRHWPDVREAIKWQTMHFTRTENPPDYDPTEHDRLVYEAERAADRFIAAFNAHRPRLPRGEARAARVLQALGGEVGDAYRAMKAVEAELHRYGRRRGNPPESKKAVQLARASFRNVDRWIAGTITYEEFTRRQRTLWKRIERAGVAADVVRLVDPLSPDKLENPATPVGELRDRAARALDLTHSHTNIGPKSFNARNRLAEWLDRGAVKPYRGAVTDVKWLEKIAKRAGSGHRLPEHMQPLAARRNPPVRLEQFRLAAQTEIVALVTTETELRTAVLQALEMADRGAPIPEWLRDRVRGLQAEVAGKIERVKTAVARHAAALGEFSTPATRGPTDPRRSRRENPSRDRAAAVELYRAFHGAAPQAFHTERIPDLHQLVHLGRALRVDYQAARPRGPRGTPYRHEFVQGSELFTDRTGRALVILGNLKVSRAPRGRFGYIRAGAGA